MRNLIDTIVASFIAASIWAVVAAAPQPRVRQINIDTGEVWVQPGDPKTGEYAVDMKDGESKARLEFKQYAAPLKIVDARGKIVALGQKRN